MGSVSSTLNPGVADLLQTLTNVNSPVVNSPAVVSALEKAPASDIVQLSEEATQLQGMDTLFGMSNNTPTSNMSTLFESLEGSSGSTLGTSIFGTPTTGTSTAGTSATSTSASSLLANASPADQAANAQAALESVLSQGLFGTGISNSLTGTIFSTLG
jgi:hypothetical protein